MVFVLLTLINESAYPQQSSSVRWKHLSSVQGDIEVPNKGMQQTATAVFDIDKNGINDFVVTERRIRLLRQSGIDEVQPAGQNT